jgi:hypothetical protein
MVVAWMKAKMKSHVTRLARAQIRQALENVMPQLLEFYNSPREDRISFYHQVEDSTSASLKDRLVAQGVTVEEIDVANDDFEYWMNDFSKLAQHYRSFGTLSIGKCLEHYLAYRVLRLSPGDVYIDIGAQTCPFAQALRKDGIRAYRLDSSYRHGIHGMDIGADATNTGLPDGFADALSMQDLFHLLMADADIRFVKEAARVLSRRGRFAVIPVCLTSSYVNIIDPGDDLRNIVLDQGAKRIWQDEAKSWEVRFAPFVRYYSPESFAKRIWANIPNSMVAKLIYCRNLPEMIARYPAQKLYARFMLYCEKRPSSDVSARIASC